MKNPNRLNQKDTFSLAKLIENFDNDAFENWDMCIKFFERQLSRSLTQPNIRTICKSIDVDVSKIVVTQTNTPLAVIYKRLSDLEKRLEKIENDLN